MKQYSMEDLKEIITLLRSPDGCPWDREQTHESLRKCVLEEAYEVVEAIDKQDMPNLCEELGDLLLLVTLHAEIGRETKQFDIDSVIHGLCVKLIRRHPHVFKDATANDSTEVLAQWEDIKKAEKALETASEGIRQVPKALPALIRAEKIQKKAKLEGLDFNDWTEVFGKLQEEFNEFKEVLGKSDPNQQLKIEEEYGDLLFSMVNLSRFLGLNAEFSLTNAIEKFINRFEGVEKTALSKGCQLRQLSHEEMNVLWDNKK